MNTNSNFMIQCHQCHSQNLKRVTGITSLENDSKEDGHILHMSAVCLDCGFQSYSYEHDSRFPNIDLTIQNSCFLDTDLNITYFPFVVSLYVEVSSSLSVTEFLFEVDPEELSELIAERPTPIGSTYLC